MDGYTSGPAWAGGTNARLEAQNAALREQLEKVRSYAEDRAAHGRRNDIVGSARIASDLFQILGVKHDWEGDPR